VLANGGDDEVNEVRALQLLAERATMFDDESAVTSRRI
jgi:hypothetical protein